MPYSSDSGKEYIKQLVTKLKPKDILDVGAGSGTYPKLLKSLCGAECEWTGIEVWEPYVEQFDLRKIYNTLYNLDVTTAIVPFLQQYDLGILGDVLEHMTKEQAVEVFKKMTACCKNIIISIPLGYYPQDEYEGNPYEKHITDNWSYQDVIDVFGEPIRSKVDNEIGVFLYGEDIKMKIAVYAISKNEEQFVKRFCESAKDADVILIADTGSTDKTVELAKECGAMVHDIFINPWRFDMARDTALALIPSDVDVCISLDLDEELQPGWREEIERVWKEDTTRLRYKFDWGCGIAFFYEKIHHRKGYRWHHPCHEYPTPDPRINEVWAHTDMLLVVHKPDPTKSRGQYLPLLELAVKEDPRCPRNAFYYARELTFYNKWLDAIVALNKYLSMPEATWVNERCYAMRLLGKSYDALGQDGRDWYRKAANEAPGTREPWVELAESASHKNDWNECYSAAKRALTITNKEDVYTMNPLVWQALPHDLAALSAYHLGFKEEAIKQGELALQFEPENERLKTNLKFYKEE